MNKHTAQIKSRLSLAIAMACLAPFVAATQSNETLPVHGQGAPRAPTLTLNQPLKVGQASTATASGYSDPDSDPLASWEYEWRTAAAGAGTLLGTGASYTPANTNDVYLRSRAIAARGYPAAQKTGAWVEQKLTPVMGDVVTTPGGTFSKPSGSEYDWSQANSYCSNLSQGGYSDWRLPSTDELVAFYNQYPGNKVNTVLGWPTNNMYWSSTAGVAGTHYNVSLHYGYVSSYNVDDSNYVYVTCVR